MKKILLYGLLSISLYGCGKATHLIYAHDTAVGIDVAVSTEGTGRIVLGYDRDTFAIVPRKGDNEDAMTLTSFGCIYIDGLNEIKYNHFVSTGDAAKNIAKSPSGLKSINDAINGGSIKCAQ
ncbi:conserved hypothetical protein [Bathymodiolus platifrons methanotrophic gill symbiont]|uniref:hypothetical protein n=1 Tax=Bathymodiolus platifrons methanotrophic gill symbiont TaxID=113268 RepID=UPI000B40B81F|nr:hypothetical protein [Bathymodiolus platifrons methanotrophic gill symbiont]TXK99161.1 hypothetical protein BMR02_08025 [Methylococcaceae bacterium HT1]TXL13989.1 hypothetical protein BMR05_09025 [Methylococcaceae bacterium HT4]TXL16623.1 hypothetical protein BMR04_09035 [Methylococcaceae bacterium HT3]TXL18149.1 hypothetical protein BMR03_15860 [Methylococcaceae bacterium HT2]TXL19735.1 hypothetical protein BMR06_08415 [Methylococcaceae bacterium HT5]